MYELSVNKKAPVIITEAFILIYQDYSRHRFRLTKAITRWSSFELYNPRARQLKLED
jgi:hypothetical protein